MRKNKPRIGYTTRNFSIDPLQWALSFAIRIAGGVPVRLRPKSPRYDTHLDALVIGGGDDLYPALYNLDPKPDYEYDHERDELEVAWLERAEALKLPILGICRGAQLINVRRGGTLHVDVSKVYENAKYPAHFLANIFYRKNIRIEPQTLLHNLLGCGHVRVNSMHKQAIDSLGRGLNISARENNGVVQAIEDPNRAYYLGVQFHPEALVYRATFRNIFERLVKAAGSR